MGRDNEDMRNSFFSRPTEVYRPGGGGNDDSTVTNERAYPAMAPTLGPDAASRQPTALPGGGASDAATRLIRPDIGPAAARPADDIAPVTGWLVVVAGPGRGHARPLGYGVNNVGRGADARVRLDFDDEEMSRSAHCTVIYDGRNKQFFIQQGSGSNLTYVDGAPVLTPRPLAGGERIDIGRTGLRFVRLCGDDFDWADEGAQP